MIEITSRGHHVMMPRIRFSLPIAVAYGLAIGPGLRAAIPEEQVKRAVEQGVAALKKAQSADGRFGGELYGSGSTSLAALALLECGVNPEDEQIRRAVE